MVISFLDGAPAVVGFTQQDQPGMFAMRFRITLSFITFHTIHHIYFMDVV